MRRQSLPAIVAALAVSTPLVLSGQTGSTPASALLERAKRLHAEVPLIDGHNDIP